MFGSFPGVKILACPPIQCVYTLGVVYWEVMPMSNQSEQAVNSVPLISTYRISLRVYQSPEFEMATLCWSPLGVYPGVRPRPDFQLNHNLVIGS